MAVRRLASARVRLRVRVVPRVEQDHFARAGVHRVGAGPAPPQSETTLFTALLNSSSYRVYL
jgi:hypothetical protein